MIKSDELLPTQQKRTFLVTMIVIFTVWNFKLGRARLSLLFF
jgi:hypothetical protein